MANATKKISSIDTEEHLTGSLGEIVGQETIERLRSELDRHGFDVSSILDAGAKGIQKVRSLVRTYPIPAIALLGVGMGLALGVFSRSSRRGR